MTLHDEVKVGDTIGVSLPRGGLRLGGEASRFAFVAGGIGVTPFLSAAASLQRTARDFKLHLMARGAPPLPHLLEPFLQTGQLVLHDTASGERPGIAALIRRPSPAIAIGRCGPAGIIQDLQKAALE